MGTSVMYSPKVGDRWKALSDEEREQVVRDGIDSRFEFVRIDRISKVVLRTREPLSTPERGTILLNIERGLRKRVDQSIEVFLEPVGDINKLRQRLRGVSVD